MQASPGTEGDDTALARRIVTSPPPAGLGWPEARIARLSGSSGASFLVQTAAGRFVLRAGPAPAHGFVDRGAEIAAARIAAAAGLGPPLVMAGPADAFLVTAFVGEGRTLADASAAGLDARGIEWAGGLLGAWHRTGGRIDKAFEPGAALDRYRARLPYSPWPEEAEAAIAAALRVIAGSAARVLCHGDPVPANMVIDGERLLLVDFEYAAMADPAWDLACLAVEADLSAEQVETLRLAHGGGVAAEVLEAHRLLAAAIGVLWSAQATDAADHSARLSRLRRLVARG